MGTANTRHLRKSIVNNLLIFVTVHSDYLGAKKIASSRFQSPVKKKNRKLRHWRPTARSLPMIISSPGPKVQVNYCHHLASVVCCLSSVVCKLFTFQASSPKPLGQLEPNFARMFLGWSSTKLLFFVPVGYSTWLPGPIICSDWLKFQRSSSLKLMN